MIELLFIRVENFRRDLFYSVSSQALEVLCTLKPEDLVVLDIHIGTESVLNQTPVMRIKRARLFTKEVFDEILAGK